MAHHSLAGRKAPAELLVDVAKLERDYYELRPDGSDPSQAVAFGTSGHRGTSSAGTFNEAHILAITQAICEYRRAEGVTGPLFMGMDTHALSRHAHRTALEVLAGNGVEVAIQQGGGYTPTPAVSHAILAHNRGRGTGKADGIIITPSHNPPADGGFKYNPPYGGPAQSDATQWIQNRANELLRGGNRGVLREPYERAIRAPGTRERDFCAPYVEDLPAVIDLARIREARVSIGVDPLGGASVGYWQPIAEKYGLDLTVVNPAVDPQFAFMTVDHDGKIRMDCSSPHAMAGLIAMKDRFQVAFGNDPDADRHGIVTPEGLMNPNHFLAVAIHYLSTHRPQWPAAGRIGKTVVSSSVIDRVVHGLNRPLYEVPVGFKWFAPGLYDGSLLFGGEESAGASFQRMDGTAWSTDKDGLILALLAAEIAAVTGRNPAQYYAELTRTHGAPSYTRIDAPVTPAQKEAFRRLTAESLPVREIAGDPVVRVLTRAPGNNEPIGGIKVETREGWFAARPSGTENLYKLYAESFRGEDHLERIVRDARQVLATVLGG